MPRILSFFLRLAVFLIGTISSRAEVTIITTSSKGWEKNETFNNLGLTTSSVLSGPGMPAASLTPDWRADGSLKGVSLNIGGDTHSATFKPNGTLATLTAPGKGDILGGHTFSNGVEILTVDGTTTERKLDGTQVITSGSNVIGKTEKITPSGTGFKQSTTPTMGAVTEVESNAAGAQLAKVYASDPVTGVGIPGESREYLTGGLLDKITLARGGKLIFGYSNDGAKDLTSATWPQVTSGSPVVFTIPAIVQNYGHDRAGRVDEIVDSSGARAMVYQNGRLKQTVWNSGPLGGYKIIKGLDDYGRETGFELWRGNVMIHAAQSVPNGVSGEVSSITASGFSAILGRNGARHLESITRGSVTQRWQRGTAGRILLADTNNTVSGAPSFNYKGTANDEDTAFDSKGRRLKCATAGGEWNYQYTNGRLTRAEHKDANDDIILGDFNYGFDGIGRRTDKGSTNTSDLLNRTLAWTNSQNKTLKVAAHPDARVWVGIGTATLTEIPSFTGAYNFPITLPPGAPSGWVAWSTLAVLEGEGDAGANPDAKAQHSGAVWVPPVNESFTFDAAGNRESSALWDFGWDAKNNLVRARTINHNSAVQGYDLNNAYDAERRRFSKKVNRYQNGQIVDQKVITFLHDGNDIVYEREQLPSGLTICERKYVWGPDISGTHGGAGGAGGLLLIRETKGNLTIDLYPLYDGSGNVVALADSTGNLQAEYGYTPFGEVLYARGPRAQSCPFRFATKYHDQETGLFNFGKRSLDPITGQWLSRDPLGESESINLYAYCGNDPINYVDVDGLWRINTQKAANDQRVEWLLMQLSIGSGVPTAPLDGWKLYFPESRDFGLYKPYGPEDYSRAQTFVQNLGRPTLRASTWEEAEAARQPSFGPAPEWIPSLTGPLTLGAANTPLNAQINSDWLLPTGAGAAGAKFLFGGMKSMLPLLAAGTRMEGNLLTAEVRSGEMLSLGSRVGTTTLNSGTTTFFNYSLKSLIDELALPMNSQRTLLRGALQAAGTGKISHHLVPLESLSKYRSLMERAASGGFNINGKGNGALLYAFDHIGGHPQYNRIVMAELEQIRRLSRGLSDAQVAGLLQDSADILRAAIGDRSFLPTH